ncbi:MAG: hypothetical protein RL033_6480 [Pseudomonadota bacterium]|jgi:hypothetical protein
MNPIAAMSLPPAVQSVLELFQGPLSQVRFADVDAAGLAQLATEVKAAAAEVEAREASLVELRQALSQRQEALVALAHQALAYARVYAENNDEPLLELIGSIALPRATQPRAAKTRKPGKAGARDGAPAESVSESAASVDAELGEAADAGPDEAPARAARKGRPRSAQATAS